MRNFEQIIEKHNLYLVVKINENKYAIPMYYMSYMLDNTIIPNMTSVQKYTKVNIALNGKYLPIFNSMLEFGKKEKLSEGRVNIVVLSIDIDEKTQSFGIMVNSIVKRVNINKWEIQHYNEFKNSYTEAFIYGTVNIDNELVRVIDCFHLQSIIMEEQSIENTNALVNTI